MSIFDSITGLFSGSQNTSGTRTNQGTSTGTSNATGATANTQSVDPRYQQRIGQALGQAQGLYDPARSLVQGAAAPTSFGQVQGLLNPYAQSQVQANFASLQPQFQDQISQLKGSQSANPYASSNSGAEARLRGQQANTLGQISSGIYGQSYGQALNAAQTDAARQLSAGQGLGQLSSQYLGQFPGLVGAGGQTTSGAGTTNLSGQTSGTTSDSGTSNSTTTNTPSIASTLGTIAGIGADILPLLASDERVKDNIKEVGRTHDGQPIYKFNYKGEPTTRMGLMAQDVEETHPHAVGSLHGLKMVDYDAATKGAERKAGGGPVTGAPVSDFASKVRDAFHVFSDLHERARGGAVRRYDDGGGVPFGDWDSPSPTGSENPVVGDGGWGATVERAPPGMSLMDRAQGILGAFGKMGGQSASAPTANQPKAPPPDDRAPRDLGPPRNSALDALQGAMAATGHALQPRGAADGGRQAYADGGSEDSWHGSLVKGLTPNSPFAAPDSPGARVLRDEYGVDPRAMYSPSRNLVRTLTSINPMVPGGPATLTGIPQRMADEDAAAFKGAGILHNDAQLRGKFASGADTLAGKAQPSEIAQREAQTALTKAETTAAGLEPKKQIEEFKQKTAREFAAQTALHDELARISKAESYEALPADQAARRRKQAYDLYYETLRRFQDIKQPPAAPLAPKLPSGTELILQPDGTLAPAQQ